MVRQVEEGAEKESHLALEDDWRHVIEAWDHGCKSRYRSRARRCGKELAQRLIEGKDLEAALNACWEFAHEPSNATSCGSLARSVASQMSRVRGSGDTHRGVSRGLALVQADEGICTRTRPKRFGLSSGRSRGT